MSDQFSNMDGWTSDDVSSFKNQAKTRKREKIQIQTSEAKVFSSTVIAKGDSWFDYLPGTDIIDCLRNHHDLVKSTLT